MIERYSMIVGDSQVTDPEGDWVRYEDHLKIVRDLEQELSSIESMYLELDEHD